MLKPKAVLINIFLLIECTVHYVACECCVVYGIGFIFHILSITISTLILLIHIIHLLINITAINLLLRILYVLISSEPPATP